MAFKPATLRSTPIEIPITTSFRKALPYVPANVFHD
jgi:hypothetical protein